MRCQVIVDIDVSSCDDELAKLTFAECQAATLEAVRNMLELGEQNGFPHTLAAVLSMHVVGVYPNATGVTFKEEP